MIWLYHIITFLFHNQLAWIVFIDPFMSLERVLNFCIKTWIGSHTIVLLIYICLRRLGLYSEF